MLDFRHALLGRVRVLNQPEMWQIKALYVQGGYQVGGADHITSTFFSPANYVKQGFDAIPYIINVAAQALIEGMAGMCEKDGVVFRVQKVQWDIGYLHLDLEV